jgi:Uma2 family endonuclease
VKRLLHLPPNAGNVNNMGTLLLPAVAPVFFNDELAQEFVFHIPRDAYTLAGFRKWVLSDEFPEKQPVMFLKGEIYLYMPKEDVFTHAAVKTAVAGTIFNLNQELDLGDFYINGVLVTNVEADVSGNPDMVCILWDSLESGKVRYVNNDKDRTVEIEGSPDWLLEIVSNGSVKKDKVELRETYHKAGVREYWIIDARGDAIDFQILHWRKTGYAAAPRKAGWQRSRVFGRSFQLTRSRDRRGAWRYALATKAD